MMSNYLVNQSVYKLPKMLEQLLKNSPQWYEIVQKYLQFLKGKQFSILTIRNYLTDIAPFFDYMNINKVSDLNAVNRTSIRQYLAQLHELGYNRASIARKLYTLRSFFSFLVDIGKVKHNHTVDVLPIKKYSNLPYVASVNEIERLINAPNTSTPLGIRDKALLETIYSTGLRVSEVIGINVDDIKLIDREIRVIGKGNKQRVVIIGRTAIEWIQNYINNVRTDLVKTLASQALFLNRYGSRLSVRSVQKIVKHYSRLAGLRDDMHTHTLRHSYATHMLAGGANLRVVQDLLGHSTPVTTQIYTHISLVDTRKVYEKTHPRANKESL